MPLWRGSVEELPWPANSLSRGSLWNQRMWGSAQSCKCPPPPVGQPQGKGGSQEAASRVRRQMAPGSWETGRPIQPGPFQGPHPHHEREEPSGVPVLGLGGRPCSGGPSWTGGTPLLPTRWLQPPQGRDPFQGSEAPGGPCPAVTSCHQFRLSVPVAFASSSNTTAEDTRSLSQWLTPKETAVFPCTVIQASGFQLFHGTGRHQPCCSSINQIALLLSWKMVKHSGDVSGGSGTLLLA